MNQNIKTLTAVGATRLTKEAENKSRENSKPFAEAELEEILTQINDAARMGRYHIVVKKINYTWFILPALTERGFRYYSSRENVSGNWEIYWV